MNFQYKEQIVLSMVFAMKTQTTHIIYHLFYSAEKVYH